MKTTMKSALVMCGMITALSSPLTASGDTSVFSSQGAYLETGAQDEALYFYLTAVENASKSKSLKDASSGAYAYGFYNDGATSYYFNGDTTAIVFEANGKIPDKVTASGSIMGTWVACDADYNCVDYAADTVQFSVEASALTDQVYGYWGTRQIKGAYIQNEKYDGSTAPAALNNSVITSTFGTINPNGGNVGQFKSHSVQIIK
jgi:hypothetical protein